MLARASMECAGQAPSRDGIRTPVGTALAWRRRRPCLRPQAPGPASLPKTGGLRPRLPLEQVRFTDIEHLEFDL